MGDSQPMLSVDDIHVYYGNIAALKGLSFNVEQGEIVTLLGSNGAGKSTTLRTVSGLLRPRKGGVSFQGRRVDSMQAHEVVGLGVAQAPEGRRIFARMTVAENLDLGAYSRTDKAAIAEDLENVLELFPRLRERIGQKAGTMSGGEQQMLAVARAMMARPKLLLLDEPSMGLAPVLVDLIFDTIVRIRRAGHDGPAGGAERVGRTARRGPRLRARVRCPEAVRPRRGAVEEPGGHRGLPRRLAAAQVHAQMSEDSSSRLRAR